MENLKYIIESLVFVSETPLSLNQLQSILEAVDRRDIRLALAELQGEYEDRQGGFRLQEVAGGFQFRTRAEHSDWIKKLLKPSPTRLSRAALETLAIIAYKQPIIRADVEHIRGVDSGGVLRMLLERKLIRVLGRKDIPGRPMIYGTTKEFLEIFNLKNLSELPSPREITSLGAADTNDNHMPTDDAQKQLAALSTGTSPAVNVSAEAGLPVKPTAVPDATAPSTVTTVVPGAPNDETFAGSGGGHQPLSAPDEQEDKMSHDETSAMADRPDTGRSPADDSS